jgi:hypothetical protein
MTNNLRLLSVWKIIVEANPELPEGEAEKRDIIVTRPVSGFIR